MNPKYPDVKLYAKKDNIVVCTDTTQQMEQFLLDIAYTASILGLFGKNGRVRECRYG